MRTTLVLVAAAAALCLSGCGDDSNSQPADSGLPAVDVSNMSQSECEAVKRMSIKQGVSPAEVDRRVNCAGLGNQHR